MAGYKDIEPKWEPGESGNPAGRPKGSLNRSTIARKWLQAEEKAKNPISGQQEKLSQEDIMTLAMIKKARSGDVSAYRALLDSAFGAPKQALEHTGEDGGPMQVTMRGTWVIQDHTGGITPPGLDE